MASRLADRIAEAPKEVLFLAAGVVVIVAQLISMAMLAQGQVQRAALRETLRESTRLALMDCLESNPRLTVRACAARAAMDVGDAERGRFGDNSYAAAAIAPGLQRGGIVPASYHAVR